MARDTPWVVATCVLSVIAALLSWYLVEKRALRMKNGPPEWLQRYWFAVQSTVFGRLRREAAASSSNSLESRHAAAPLASKKAG
jgi:peptidoglycan/LPS O-acetylase OafA/YrhL